MASAEELLEELLEKQLELVRAKKGSEREEALEKRIDALEKQLARKPRADVDDAFEELTEEEEELLRKTLADHRAAPSDPRAAAPPADPPADPPAVKRTRPGMKRGGAYSVDPATGEPLDHAFVYGGEDEPDTVELEDAA